MSMNYHDVPLENIKVGERFRKDLGDMDGFIRAVEIRGFIFEPIIIDREDNLLAGGRRYEAYRRLGKVTIPAIYLDDVDDIVAREIELEENIHRKDFTQWEVIDLTKEIHELKMRKYANHSLAPSVESGKDSETGQTRLSEPWSQVRTAEFIGDSSAGVSRKLFLARAAEIMPELRDIDVESQALRKIDQRLEELEREFDRRALERAGKLEDSQRHKILLGDCLEKLQEVEDKSVDCIIIDPPYGVLEKGGIGRYEQHFDDDPVTAMRTLQIAAKELERVLKDNGHMYVFFGIKMWVQTKGIFDSLGFDVDPIPLVWVKTTGSVVDWDYRFPNYWEPILFINKLSARRLNFKRSNVFQYASVPNNLRVNIAEKPIGLVGELLRLSTNEDDLVLDCFAGSGVVGVAAKELGRRSILIERDQNQWNEIQISMANAVSRSALVGQTDGQDQTSDQSADGSSLKEIG